MKRILAIDLDGTLLTSQKTLSPRTLRALLAEQQSGSLLVLATGRPPHGCAPFARQLQISRFGGYLVAFNGAQILDLRSGHTLFQTGLSPAALPHLCALSRRPGCTLLTYLGDKVVTEDAQNPYVQYAARINRMSVLQAPDLAQAATGPVPKCIIAGEPAALDQITPEDGFVRSEPFFLEVMPPGVDKGTALSRLLRHLGADASCLTAFGDSYNDASMLALAGTSVAMQNARPEIRAMASHVTLSNDHDGIAHFLSRP